MRTRSEMPSQTLERFPNVCIQSKWVMKSVYLATQATLAVPIGFLRAR